MWFRKKYMCNNCVMNILKTKILKSKKPIKIIHNFKMEYNKQIIFPNLIKDRDISAMFCGLISIVKQQAKFDAQKSTEQKDSAYKALLKMYLNTLKQMNEYKSLYLKEKSKNAV